MKMFNIMDVSTAKSTFPDRKGFIIDTTGMLLI